MDPPINLYAEFLLNIRQVTLYATLRNKPNEEFTAQVSSDRKSITVSYDGVSSTIVYPSGISGDATVQIPVTNTNVISLRFDVIEDGASIHNGMIVANDSPWPASSLSSQTRIACRHCQSSILSPNERTWQDLPRSDWAEMMDFWHCHKPQSKETTNGVPVERYVHKPSLRKGLGFIDTGHIILPVSDCANITISDDHVNCSSCSTHIGIIDNHMDGVKLYKWGVLVQRSINLDWEQNDAQNFICSQLLEAMDSQGLRKFIAYSGSLMDASKAILLWVFNPDLKYSASYIDHGRPRRAMKILFKSVEDPKNILEQQSMSVDEFALPSDIMTRLEKDLERSNELIPLRAQVIQGWKVGLLDRFDPVMQ